MKKFSKLLYAFAALPLLFTSCVEELVTKPGEPDLEDCYNVYFKELSKAESTLELDPSAPTQIVLTALRPNSEDAEDLPAIKVPVEVQSPLTESGEKLFNLTEIIFEEGQTESSFNVNFPDAKLGVPYSCTIEITDPQYASVYSKNPTVLSFSVTRVKWDLMKDEESGDPLGSYREDVISSVFGIPRPHSEGPIKVYQRADKPGYFKIPNLYSAELLSTMLNDPEITEGAGDEILTIIDATNPNRVIWKVGSIGVNFGYGVVFIGSKCSENFGGVKPAESLYGTLKNGVIKFPVGGLAYLDDEGAAFVNSSGMARFILPGGKDVDYSVGAECGLTQDGVVPVMAEKGLDVATVKYAVLPGTLADKDIVANAGKIASGKLEAKVVEFPEGEYETSFGIKLSETGDYTLVLAALAEDGKTLVNAGGDHFTYVAAGDDTKGVNVHCGLILSDKYEGFGATRENSAEMYIYGKDLTQVRYGIFKKANFLKDPNSVLKAVRKAKPVKDDYLELINNSVWSSLQTGLASGIEYVLVVYATNGYEETFELAEVLMDGEPNPLNEIYSADMIVAAASKDAFVKDNWALYYLDEEKGERVNSGVVKIEAFDQKDDQGNVAEMIAMTGLWTPLFEAQGFKYEEDELYWAYNPKSGICLSLAQQAGLLTTPDGDKIYTAFAGFAPDVLPNPLFMNYLHFAGLTEQGNIAIVPNPGYLAQLQNGLYLGLVGYTDAELTTPFNEKMPFVGALGDVLLVDPANVPAGDTPAPAPASCSMRHQQYSAIYDSYRKNFNLVALEEYQVQQAIEESLSVPQMQGRLSDIKVSIELPAVQHEVVSISEFKTAKKECHLILK